MKNIQTNVKCEIFKKERAQKRESSVNTYRKYRIGDFPDIENYKCIYNYTID